MDADGQAYQPAGRRTEQSPKALDDAGGGRRGLRATRSAALLAALRRHYGVEGSRSRDLGGSSSRNLLVAEGSDRYVVRVYRPYVTAARLADIQLVRRELARGGVPGAPVVLIAQQAPCLILLDMNTPVMDGPEFVRRIRAGATAPAPIVCMTAAHNSERRAREIRAEATLSKPVDLDDLVALVAYHCRP